jgi:hypothetical protein
MVLGSFYGRSGRLVLYIHCMYTIHMNKLNFEWDDAKSTGNKRKHGVTFDEAESVFYDENAIEFYDPDHSRDEDRFFWWV